MRIKQDSTATQHQLFPIPAQRKPFIWISEIAYKKMWDWVSFCNVEIGWLGTAVKLPSSGSVNDEFLIEDVFLFKQLVTSVHTTATPDAMFELAERLSAVEISKMRFWGHSHVSMGAVFSEQDHTNMVKLTGGGFTDWMIGSVHNKMGEISLYMYYPDRNIYFAAVPWEVKSAENGEITTIRDTINIYCTIVPPTVYTPAQTAWENWLSPTNAETAQAQPNEAQLQTHDSYFGRKASSYEEWIAESVLHPENYRKNCQGLWQKLHNGGRILRVPAKALAKLNVTIPKYVEELVKRELENPDNLYHSST